MAGLPPQTQDQVQAMVAQVKTLTVERLKTLLRTEGLTVSGVKSELQIRSIAHIEKLRNAGDIAGLSRLRGNIRGLPPYPNNTYPSPYTPTSSASPQFSSANPHGSYTMPLPSPFGSGRIVYKHSPFYTISRALTTTYECKVRESTRDTARLTVSLTQDVVDKLNKDPSCRIMVFCAAENLQGFSRESDIAFPHNVELKCNGDEVKTNLRGLKNRPGSTRPADITSQIRKKVNYQNSVEMVYALTTKDKSTTQKFFLVVNLVAQRSIDAMVTEIKQGKILPRDQTLREMRRKAEDPDELVATSSLLSLKDPVAYTRILTPCRGMACNHNQCFDAAAYLQLQEQAPTWTCPICNKPAPWEALALDQYVNDILNATTRQVDAVLVEPDGRWHVQKDSESTNRNSNPTPSDDEDDDEDLVELGNKSALQPKLEALTPHSVRTPPLSSREDSTAPSAARSSNKRTRDVIDLTLSDDDETPAPKDPRMSDASPDPSRARPPHRYHFQLPPPPGPPPFNSDRFYPSF